MTRTRPPERRWFRWALRRYGLLIARAVYRVFLAIGRHLLAGLDKVAAWMLVTEALRRTNPAVWLPRLRAAVTDPVGRAVRAGANDERVRHARGSGRRTIDAIADRSRALVALIVGSAVWGLALATLRRAVVTALRVGVATGGAAAGIANVTALFQRRPLYIRSARVGHTEGHGAVNGGKDAARVVLFREGHVNAKRWQTMKDSDVRDAHQHAQGQTVPVGGEFVVGGERCSYPGDARLSIWNRANCRCWVSSVKVP